MLWSSIGLLPPVILNEAERSEESRMDFAAKRCVPYEGGTPPITAEEVQRALADIPGWEFEDGAIRRRFICKNFKEAVAFMNKAATLAEDEGHHPDIHLTGWNKVELVLSTHEIGGLSENDFVLAAKINEFR